jgi:hypothetical protein
VLSLVEFKGVVAYCVILTYQWCSDSKTGEYVLRMGRGVEGRLVVVGV